jgi:SOS-response transcriptional repressor LexA
MTQHTEHSSDKKVPRLPVPFTDEEREDIKNRRGDTINGVKVLHEYEVALEVFRVGKAVIDRASASLSTSVPLKMAVPCGEPREYHELMNEVGEGELVEVSGVLMGKVTPNSFIARADGHSMNGEEIDSLANGDRLLMTPIKEFLETVGELKSGTIIIAKIVYKSGAEKYTLKTYVQSPRGSKLSAKNPQFKAPEFGPNVEKCEVYAVCRGVLEKVYR